ncbi:MAG: DMT family transporter [Ktedonobacteraceae bacterium]
MRAKEYLVLFLLAALWGASFLFIKVAVAEMSPLTLVFIRLALGALGLLLFVPFNSKIMHDWHTHVRAFTIVTIFNAIIPYLTISWGEEHVSSGMAAILNAITPLVLVLVSNWWPGGERLTRQRLGAVLLGFIGVGILVGPAALTTGTSPLSLWGILACFLGASSYALGGLFARHLLAGLPLMQQAIGQIGMGAVLLVPVAGIALIMVPQSHVPSIWAIASALALALGGTTLAYICYFWLIERVGPTRTLIVTYLLPCMALVYGALILHEPISSNAIGGLVLIMLGIFFASKKSEPQKVVQTGIDTSQPSRNIKK